MDAKAGARFGPGVASAEERGAAGGHNRRWTVARFQISRPLTLPKQLSRAQRCILRATPELLLLYSSDDVRSLHCVATVRARVSGGRAHSRGGSVNSEKLLA